MQQTTQLRPVSRSELAEDIEFSVVLSGTYWGDRRPEFDIELDGTVITSGRILAPSSRVGLVNPEMTDEWLANIKEKFTFTRELEPGDHVLDIVFKNKQPGDTGGFVDGGVLRDLLLHLDAIKLDNIDITDQLHDLITYHLDRPQQYGDMTEPTDTLKKTLTMGFNGRLRLQFSTPLYIWLLENL